MAYSKYEIQQNKNAAEKKALAREICKANGCTHLIDDVCDQIQICEELGCSLTTEMIKDICVLDNDIQIEIYLRPIKMGR